MRTKKDYNFSYKNSGVDVKKADKLIKKVKPLIKSINDKNMIGGIGGFGGLFGLQVKKYKNPTLVAATDGVGTKLLIAKQLNKFDTIGIDLVAMSVNDIIVQGAKPLFFLDYIATDKLKDKMFLSIMKGIINGCKQAGCSLLGGETAELPDVYPKGGYDLAGFCVGIAERNNLLPSSKIKAGDSLLALPSSGLHSNGFSLIRKIISEKKISLSKKIFGNTTLGKVLIRPTKIYVNPILKALDLDLSNKIYALSHITGGGIVDNLKRVIPNDLGFKIYSNKLAIRKKSSIFNWLHNKCNVTEKELIKTFNCGLGMIIVVSRKNKDEIKEIFTNLKEPVQEVGEVISDSKVSFI